MTCFRHERKHVKIEYSPKYSMASDVMLFLPHNSIRDKNKSFPTLFMFSINCIQLSLHQDPKESTFVDH